MTEIAFHLGAADPLAYACRLLRKALARGATPVVTASPEVLVRLDRLLWTFDPLDFLPHVRVAAGGAEALAPRLRATPLWLAERPLDAPHHDVLVNLGDDLAPGFESFLRVIEIVPVDEGPRQAARRRWKHYADRGYPLTTHEVKAAGGAA